MKLSIPVHQLKRQAKALQERDGLQRIQALDHIAHREGFRSWSHLASEMGRARTPATVYAQLEAGDMILIGSRPGQGKTLFSLALALEAMKAGRLARFFTLEYTRAETMARLEQVGAAKELAARLFVYDGSDSISADYIAQALGKNSPCFIVVDYLQLLDQKRSNPPLTDQIKTLSSFARRTGSVIACISQIDREFVASGRNMPAVGDLRLPNPVDLAAFNRMFFLQNGTVA